MTGGSARSGSVAAAVELYWLPLGAGGHSVRINGKVFEALAARRERRARRDLYHSALVVRLPEGHVVIEQGPAGRAGGHDRGVVAQGPVGSRLLGRYRLFRYEIRRWPGGEILDLGEAVDSPRQVSDDAEVAGRLLGLVPSVPRLVWGRDDLGLGEMWNSNSVVSWLLTSCGIPAGDIEPPTGGRAPGWQAGVRLARREAARNATGEGG